MEAVWKNEDMAAYIRYQSQRAEESRKKLLGNAFQDFEAFYACIRAYTLAKYLLPEDDTEDSIDALAAKSVSLQMNIPEEILSRSDRPSGCTKATAVADKKILLILSVCKVRGIRLQPKEAPSIQTVRQLAQRLWKG